MATLPLKNNIFSRFLGQFPLKNIQQLVFTQSFCRDTNRRKETFSKYGRKVGMVPKSEGWSNRRIIWGFFSLDLDNPSDQILSKSVVIDYRFDFFLDHFVWNDPYVYVRGAYKENRSVRESLRLKKRICDCLHNFETYSI